MIHRSAARAGFTLVEIMVVLGVIAVLAGLAISNLVGITETAKIQAAQADIQTISQAVSAYELLARQKPTSGQGLHALVVRPTSEPVPKGWTQQMKEVPRDPWGREYKYRFPGLKNPSGFDLYSTGPDAQEGSSDDIGNW